MASNVGRGSSRINEKIWSEGEPEDVGLQESFKNVHGPVPKYCVEKAVNLDEGKSQVIDDDDSDADENLNILRNKIEDSGTGKSWQCVGLQGQPLLKDKTGGLSFQRFQENWRIGFGVGGWTVLLKL
ncbi:hypothetical protein CK203_009177 [Vitis vinifera]|uniref:Uncharacterized protein n=1 Tax=Vitis vinifera TaxID=29760 RepID=A0A438K2T5_VITVI|nr:hypothetical protein CK203_009177 [Vitis vinifera]